MVDNANFVDAHTGSAHIDANSLERKLQSTWGVGEDDTFVAQLLNRFNVTVIDATHVQIDSGGGFIQGRFFYLDQAQKLTVQPGAAGLNRWDAIVFRYTRDSSGIETVTPMVITGTATSGTPVLPATLTRSRIYDGSSQADMLLGRIEFVGASLSYTPLYKMMPAPAKLDESVRQLESSLSQIKNSIETLQFEKLVSDQDWDVSGVVVNGIAFIAIRWFNKNTFGLQAWGHTPIARIKGGWATRVEFGCWSVNSRVNGREWFGIAGNQIDFRTTENTSVGSAWHLGQIVCPIYR